MAGSDGVGLPLEEGGPINWRGFGLIIMIGNRLLLVRLPSCSGQYSGDVVSGSLGGEGLLKAGNISCEGYFIEGQPVGDVMLTKNRIELKPVESDLKALKPSSLLAEEWVQYTGRIDQGQASGPGTLRLSNGMIYTGIFKEGVPEGNGRLTLPDGSYLEGDFSAVPTSSEYKRFDVKAQMLQVVKIDVLGDGSEEVLSSLQLTPVYELTVLTQRPESVIPFNRQLVEKLLQEITAPQVAQKSLGKLFSSSTLRHSAFKKSKPRAAAKNSKRPTYLRGHRAAAV